MTERELRRQRQRQLRGKLRKHKRYREVQPLDRWLWMLTAFVLFAVMFAAAYTLTRWLYAWLGWQPSLLVAELLDFVLALALVSFFVSTFSNVARNRGWQPEGNLLGPVVEALERIADGDFSVRLEDAPEDNPFVGQLAASVNRMAYELDQMENLRQEFISNVSHEIQSPLTSIRGFAQLLENDQLSEEDRRHYLHIIGSETTRLSRITDDLLKMASLEAKQHMLQPSIYRLDAQIRSMVVASEPQWDAKKLKLDLDLQEVTINADEDLLSEVWINLLSNSIKFTPEGGSIKLSLQARGKQAEFRIADTGSGIPSEHLQRVFERFYKADDARTPGKGGSGLGLAIAKKIVEMHNGEISVSSISGEGAEFSVLLPLNNSQPR